MRQQLPNPAVGLSRQSFEHVLQVRKGLVAIEPRGLDQAHDRSRTLTRPQATREQPVLAPQRQFPFILPISDRMLKSIIGGIRCMGAASKFATLRSVAEAA